MRWISPEFLDWIWLFVSSNGDVENPSCKKANALAQLHACKVSALYSPLHELVHRKIRLYPHYLQYRQCFKIKAIQTMLKINFNFRASSNRYSVLDKTPQIPISSPSFFSIYIVKEETLYGRILPCLLRYTET